MAVTEYQKLKRKVVLEYLEKYKDLPSRTIARLLKRDHSELFSDLENARFMVRQYRGQSGDNHRKKVKFTKYYKDAV